MGRPMLDWILEALLSAGFRRKDVVFVCGYAEDVVRARYPEFTYVRNADWANNANYASYTDSTNSSNYACNDQWGCTLFGDRKSVV